MTRRRCARGGGGGGGGGGEKRKEGRDPSSRTKWSGHFFELSRVGRRRGGGRNARRLMAGVETSVTSVDKTECPECYLAIRSNQTETHFRTPSPPPSYPPRQIYSPNENLWDFYCLPRDYTSLYHFFSFSFENRKSFSFVESSFLLLSCKMLLLLSENGEEERKRRQGRKEKSDKKFLRQFKSNGLAGLQRHSLSARSWS